MITIDEHLYQKQLIDKEKILKKLLQAYSTVELDILPSAIQNFRMRTEFRIWHQHHQAYYAMFFQQDNQAPTFLETFPYASLKINELMPQLKSMWQKYPILKNKLFQVEFLTTLSNQSIITLCYHKKLNEEWLTVARIVAEKLNTKIIGRAKKQKYLTHDHYVQETLTILGRNYHYKQPENSFTQPNALVNQKMITWACQHLDNPHQDLLELYCGNGNFTIPFSQYVKRIFASEVSRLSIQALENNIDLNNITNIQWARLSAWEINQAIHQIRCFKRLSHIDLQSYQFNTVFVDPPRIGLDSQTCQLISQFPNIIYISCNPKSLVENLKLLSQTHRIIANALFDQFPYSPHIEAGVVLQKMK